MKLELGHIEVQIAAPFLMPYVSCSNSVCPNSDSNVS